MRSEARYGLKILVVGQIWEKDRGHSDGLSIFVYILKYFIYKCFISRSAGHAGYM
jgi:hypothetical protein